MHLPEHSLRLFYAGIAEPCTASININIDGLPLFKNGTAQVWPILVNVAERPEIPPIIAGIFYGHNKPKKVEQYLQPFVDEMLIINDGILINGQKLTVRIRSIICDAPARAFVKGDTGFLGLGIRFDHLVVIGVVNFNSINGCLKCCTIGEFSKDLRTTIFPQSNAPLRTDRGFRERLYSGHHQEYKISQERKIIRTPIETPFLKLPIDMIHDFIVSDSLHLLHLGVMKKLLLTYKDGNRNIAKWSAKLIKELSDTLVAIKLPIEIHRAMRGLDYVNHWKASEFGTFLNYIGIVVFKKVLNKEHYKNFVRLFCATTICSTNYYKRFLPVAKVLFNQFIDKYYEQFGSVTSNIHNLVHVVDEIERKGPLPSISTYPFENHLQQIKKTVRSGRLPLSQIINRMSERDSHNFQVSSDNQTFPSFKEPSKIDKSQFHRLLINSNCTLRSKSVDKWFLTKEHQIIGMNFANSEGIYGNEIITPKSLLFDDPLTSFCLNVFIIKGKLTYNDQRLYPMNSMLCKLVIVISDNDTVFVPMLHTYPLDERM